MRGGGLRPPPLTVVRNLVVPIRTRSVFADRVREETIVRIVRGAVRPRGRAKRITLHGHEPFSRSFVLPADPRKGKPVARRGRKARGLGHPRWLSYRKER